MSLASTTHVHVGPDDEIEIGVKDLTTIGGSAFTTLSVKVGGIDIEFLLTGEARQSFFSALGQACVKYTGELLDLPHPEGYTLGESTELGLLVHACDDACDPPPWKGGF